MSFKVLVSMPVGIWYARPHVILIMLHAIDPIGILRTGYFGKARPALHKPSSAETVIIGIIIAMLPATACAQKGRPAPV